jgi:hypothetical protein
MQAEIKVMLFIHFFFLQRMGVRLAEVAVGVVPQLAILKSKDFRFSLSI